MKIYYSFLPQFFVDEATLRWGSVCVREKEEREREERKKERKKDRKREREEKEVRIVTERRKLKNESVFETFKLGWNAFTDDF